MIFNSSLFHDVQVSHEKCKCHGMLSQMDAKLPDETQVRVMLSRDGYHVSVGVPGDVPAPIASECVVDEIIRQWRELKDGVK